LQSLWLLQAGALLVLLIGGVNVVNLFLARMNAKRAELAIRVALGAGPWTLLRQVVLESLLLTAAAAATGVGVAGAMIRVFNQYVPRFVRPAPPVTLDPTVVMVALGGALVLAISIGVFPHLLLWRTGLRLGHVRGATSTGAARVTGGTLVITQVAVAVVLLVGAGLLIRSFAKVMAIEPGFDAPHLVQGRIAPPARFQTPEAMEVLQRRIQEAFREISGVEHTAQVNNYVLLGDTSGMLVRLRDESAALESGPPRFQFFPISPEYFDTMGIRLLAGRGFTDEDSAQENPVVIVDETFVQRFYPGRLVVGREVWVGSREPPEGATWPRIIGVVSRANLNGLERYGQVPFAFVPAKDWRTPGFNVVVRSRRPAADVLRDMRTKLREIDPAIPLYQTASLQEMLDEQLAPRRGIMLLLGTFAGLALLLAAIGLYGMLAYDVSQRTREIGIRGALGAARGDIIALILRQGLWKTGCGLGLGLIGGYVLSRYLESLLFEVTTLDPIAYVAVGAGLLAFAALASWLPARRAAKVDPIVALRAE